MGNPSHADMGTDTLFLVREAAIPKTVLVLVYGCGPTVGGQWPANLNPQLRSLSETQSWLGSNARNYRVARRKSMAGTKDQSVTTPTK